MDEVNEDSESEREPPKEFSLSLSFFNPFFHT
jgi:hypothetical protein